MQGMEPEIQRLLRQHKAALREQETVLTEQHRCACPPLPPEHP